MNIPSNPYDEKTAQELLSAHIKFIQDHRSGSATPTGSSKDWEWVITTCDTYVNALRDQYKDRLNQELSKCSSDPFLMSLAKLDRLVTAEKFASLTAVDPKGVKSLYATSLSGKLLDKWLSESTHEARKSNSKSPNDKLVDSEFAEEAFLRHPEEVDFLTESFIHKQMGRLSEHVHIDPATKHHQIRYEGDLQDVSSLAPLFTLTKKKKLHSIEGDQRYFFCQDKGLTQFDPENWTTLPVFRKRQHAKGDDDYRLVLKTLIKEDSDDKHSWIELKTPTEVYNVGYFWNDEKDSIEYGTLCKTLRGKLHTVDKNELLGKEKFIQKTVSKISKDQFEIIKTAIETFQNKTQEKMFNLINSNCTSWTCKILKPVGLTISSKENASRYLLGKKVEYGYEDTTFFGKIERCWHRFLAVLRNLLVYLLSGAEAVLTRDKFDEADLPFKSISETLDPEKGFFDTPRRVREWQDEVVKQRAEEEERLRAEEWFPTLSEVEQETRLNAVRYALPTLVTLPEPVVTF